MDFPFLSQEIASMWQGRGPLSFQINATCKGNKSMNKYSYTATSYVSCFLFLAFGIERGKERKRSGCKFLDPNTENKQRLPAGINSSSMVDIWFSLDQDFPFCQRFRKCGIGRKPPRLNKEEREDGSTVCQFEVKQIGRNVVN